MSIDQSRSCVLYLVSNGNRWCVSHILLARVSIYRAFYRISIENRYPIISNVYTYIYLTNTIFQNICYDKKKT